MHFAPWFRLQWHSQLESRVELQTLALTISQASILACPILTWLTRLPLLDRLACH